MIPRKKKMGLVGMKGLALVGWVAVVMAGILVPWGAAAESPAPSAALSPELPRQELPEPILDSLRSALDAYEEVRRELVADRLEGVPASALRLAGALHRALEDRTGLPGEISDTIEKAARMAESMASVSDLPAARAAFGEVSRLILLLASSDSRLAEGWHVFSCPMVETFNKWIQPTAALENPYMGQAMLACGGPTDWSVPAPSLSEEVGSSTQEAGSPGANGDSGEEPVFIPGIPGLKMVDVRDHMFLWREIEELQKWERGDRISIAEFRSKVIEKTVHFLGLSGAAAERFATTASEAVASIRESFFQMRQAGENPAGKESQFSFDLNAAVNRVISLLQTEPRHQLFAPECKKWLLKLAFGPSEAKESREAAQVKADKSGRGGSGG